jgi:hypothetical protein
MREIPEQSGEGHKKAGRLQRRDPALEAGACQEADEGRFIWQLVGVLDT